MFGAPLIRVWLYLFADMNTWLAVMSRADQLAQERGRFALAEAQTRARDVASLRERWIWRLVFAELEVRTPIVRLEPPRAEASAADAARPGLS